MSDAKIPTWLQPFVDDDKKRDLKSDLTLDKDNLDICALEQPEIYGYWSLRWALAMQEREVAKDLLERTKAEAASEIRANPSKFGWDALPKSPTETFISLQVPLHPDVMEAQENFLEAQKAVYTLGAMKEALEQRMKSIQALANLYSSNYFATAVSHKISNEAIDKIQEQHLRAMKKYMEDKKREGHD